MSFVKISEELHSIARARARVFNRSINMQAEHWMRIGKLIEENPDMTYRDIWKLLLEESEAETSDAN